MAAIDNLMLDISQTIEIQAAPADAFAALLQRLTTENSTPNNQPMPMVLEAWPGGRWFRDLGDEQGHLWGFVQVIKPPTLIEIHGPMFMSYAVAGHVQFRLTPTDRGTDLSLRHQVLGSVSEEHQQGMHQGWGHMLQQIKQRCEA